MAGAPHRLLRECIEDFRLRNEPYEIQKGFMDDLLKCFDSGSIGFFESPTGTGKSLSVLCASIAYLRDKNRGFRFSYDASDDDVDSDIDDDKPRPTRLIVATRTHSQIKELIGELKRLRGSAQAKIQKAPNLLCGIILKLS